MMDVLIMHSSFSYAAIGVLAVLPIYAGSHASLRRPQSAPKAKATDEKEVSLLEKLGSQDAMLFPLLGGAMLATLYLVITYVSKEWLNYFFSIYFSIMGVASNFNAIRSVARYMIPSIKSLPEYKFAIRKQRPAEEQFSVSCSAFDVVLACMSIGLSVVLASSNNWIVSNLFGLSFSYNAMQLIGLDSFRTGMILLTGLFFYDIYFVFGTTIMVTVAKGLDAPIKLTFPKDILTNPSGPATMLGLGDIVVPGVYVALSLRYDLFEYHRRHPDVAYRKGWFNFPKPYFTTTMIAYILGLATTVIVLHTFQAAQPALLYLSPACILSTVCCGLYRNELSALWQYSEGDDDDENNKKID